MKKKKTQKNQVKLKINCSENNWRSFHNNLKNTDEKKVVPGNWKLKMASNHKFLYTDWINNGFLYNLIGNKGDNLLLPVK